MDDKNNTLLPFDCSRKKSTAFIATSLLLFPVHIFMLNILLRSTRLTLPRHNIFASLAVSDFTQTYGILLSILHGQLFEIKATSLSCQFNRKFLEIIGAITVVTSSGSILAMSIERYVACVHCFRVHTIFTETRVKRIIYAIWITGTICGFIDYKRYIPNYSFAAVPLTATFGIIYIIVVVPTSVVVLIIQIQLYRLSMRKTTVHPSYNFGRQAEARDVRRQQLKLSLSASYVIIMYMACMLPLASYIVSTGFKEINDESMFRTASLLFTSINALIDPFVYGVGMPDTRREMKRELKALKDKIMSFF
eukprot:gene16598-18287_t